MCLIFLMPGCIGRSTWVGPSDQRPIDRSAVEYPAGFQLVQVARGLNAPSAIAFDADGSLLIVEGGADGGVPRIFGRRVDGTEFQIYPRNQRLPFGIGGGFRVYGPVGGLLSYQGKIYVSHRDKDRKGVITAFDYDGNHQTVVADLPAQGEHGVTDLAVAPNGRIYFGVGSATNSGVVGLDNWSQLWLRDYPNVCDIPLRTLFLNGFRFDTRNPRAGLLGGDDVFVTGPYQGFGSSNQTRIRAGEKPTAAIYSVAPGGGDLKVEATGARFPRGLAFNEFGRLFFTNNGMQMRGTRPVKDDPDVLLRLVPGADYGFPDYSADLFPITEERFQPPTSLSIKTGYPDLSRLVDAERSNLIPPERGTLLQAIFPSLSGASKMHFVPAAGPFQEYRGSVIVALHGDQAPFATSGVKLLAPVGYKVVRVDVDTRQVVDFVKNTSDQPASFLRSKVVALERPVDVKFGPDGAMYILDFGRLENRSGVPKIRKNTGGLFKLIPAPAPVEAPATQP